MDLFDIAPKGWWDGVGSRAVDIADRLLPPRTQAVAFLDICLLLASQQYEATTAGFTEEGDQLLLLASQRYENEANKCYGRVTRSAGISAESISASNSFG